MILLTWYYHDILTWLEVATLGTSCFGVWLLGEMGFYGVYYVFLFWLWMGFCAWVLRFWRRALGEKMEQCYFSFISGVVRVYCGPFQAFKVSDLYLDSYLYFSPKKKKILFIYLSYINFTAINWITIFVNYSQKLQVLVKVTINHNLSYRNNHGLACSTKIFV